LERAPWTRIDLKMDIAASESSSRRSSTELEEVFRTVLRDRFPLFRDAQISAAFYPYIGLTHTIRRKGSRWVVRISDHCGHAPSSVLEAIFVILACKVSRRRPPREQAALYEKYRQDPLVKERVQRRRRSRGRKRINTAEGKYHSLQGLYAELNRRYFHDQIEISSLGWGLRPSWRRLGHYDPVHHAIVISPVLDSPRVPRYVLAYILYHELLHTLYDEETANGRKRHHHREYLKAERSFPDYRAAKSFLGGFCRMRRTP
jgi:hypothetical protein